MKDLRADGARIIGLCGRSGSGKTTVSDIFRKFGVMPIDTDNVYRQLICPAGDGTPSSLVRKIADEFGDDVILPDGSLNRAVLASKVFGEGNSENLRRLNLITHEPILSRTAELAEEYIRDGARGVLVDAPALFESGFHEKCDVIICVSAPDDVLIRRIMARDSVDDDAAYRRLSSQISDAELRRKCDFVIENFGDNDLFSSVKEIIGKILD